MAMLMFATLCTRDQEGKDYYASDRPGNIIQRSLSLLICFDPAGSYLKGRAGMESQAERGSGRDGNEEVRIQTFYKRTLCIDQFSSLFVFTGKQNIVK